MSNQEPRALSRTLALLLLAAGLVSACGGGSSIDDEGRAMPLAETSPTASARTIAPLLDDEGGVMAGDPAAVPEDPAARTRAARYATEAQAAQVEAAMGATAIALQVEPSQTAVSAPDLAVTTAYGLQAAHGLPPGAPVFVRGADLRLAAAAADRIADAGFTRVFLVTR
jgi:hypothetical protein